MEELTCSDNARVQGRPEVQLQVILPIKLDALQPHSHHEIFGFFPCAPNLRTDTYLHAKGE